LGCISEQLLMSLSWRGKMGRYLLKKRCHLLCYQPYPHSRSWCRHFHQTSIYQPITST